MKLLRYWSIESSNITVIFCDEIWYFATKFEHANFCKVNTKAALARLKGSHIKSTVCAGSFRQGIALFTGTQWWRACGHSPLCAEQNQPLSQTPPKPTLIHLQLFTGPGWAVRAHCILTSLKTGCFHLCLVVLCTGRGDTGETYWIKSKILNEQKDLNSW